MISIIIKSLKISLFTAITLALAACASTQIQATHPYTGKPLAKPEKILVYDFAVSSEDVKTNRALGVKLANYVEGRSQSAEELAIGRAVAQSLSQSLVKDLRARGLPAQYASGSPPPHGNVVLITGHFLNVDEGNRLRRMVIGFGAGSSRVKTQVQVFYRAPSKQQLIAVFNTLAKSSRKPGIAPLTGVGTMTGHVAVSLAASTGLSAASEVFGANVEADAKRTATKIVEQLLPIFAQQGWVPGHAKTS